MTLELKTQKDKIRFAVEHILTHFEEPQWPRNVQSKMNNGIQFKANSIDEALDYFEKSNYLDCRISVFSEHEINEVLPNGIFIDLDNVSALHLVKARIYRLIKGVPLVIFTGRGLALLQPIEIKSMKHLVHENLDGETISKEFLRFMKDYLTGNRADPANHPSLKNCLLRVPYTVNSKNNKQVEFKETWNKQRASIRNIPFKQHIKKIIEKNKRKNCQTLTVNPENFSWIENLLQDRNGNFGEQITAFVLSRYLVNVKQLDVDQSVSIIKQWISYPNRRKLSKSEIRHRCNKALKDGKLPVSLETIKQNNPGSYQNILAIPGILKHNENVEPIEGIKVANYDEKTNKFFQANVIGFEHIGYSKTKDLYHFLLQCYDCNPRGAGAFEINENSYRFHEKNCKNIRYLARDEEVQERTEARYSRPLTDTENKLLREIQ